MEFIFFVGGVVLGIILTLIHKSREKIHGVIHIDHNTEQCVFCLTNEELSNRKTKTAVFVVNHDATLSRE